MPVSWSALKHTFSSCLGNMIGCCLVVTTMKSWFSVHITFLGLAQDIKSEKSKDMFWRCLSHKQFVRFFYLSLSPNSLLESCDWMLHWAKKKKWKCVAILKRACFIGFIACLICVHFSDNISERLRNTRV